MPGLRRVTKLRKLLLLLPCDPHTEEVLDTASLASEMDDPDDLVWARSHPGLCGPDSSSVLGV